MKTDQIYKTHDLSLANSLCLIGFKLIKIEPAEGNKVWFVFDGSNKVLKHVDRYWKHLIRLDPQEFTQGIKALKARIFDEFR